MKDKNIKGKKAKGYSDMAKCFVEGTITYICKNGVFIVSSMGNAFVEDGKWELIKTEV